MKTVLLHGFWGAPQDWLGVLSALPLHHRIWTPDLYVPGPLAPHHQLGEWTDHFLEELDRELGSEPVQIVGYSMGGRMAVQALVRKPMRFSRALILSANPIYSAEDLAEREPWQKDWTLKFQNEPWEKLESEWQELGIFSASQPLQRRKTAMVREMLMQSLVNWSPRHHDFTAVQLKALPSTVTWAFGASDQKYLKVAKTLQELPVQGQIVVVPGAGHRLVVDAADYVAKWMEH